VESACKARAARSLKAMRQYDAGKWGLALLFGLRGSVFPRALAIALPNAVIAFLLGIVGFGTVVTPDDAWRDSAKQAISLWAGFTSVLFFALFFRSNVAYARWWEGGTLLQQVRGEWFNAYSSLIAFSSTDKRLAQDVERYHHMLARIMSLLFCTALQQVSPDPNTPFEILNTEGLDENSMKFLEDSDDKVEVILQWVQRSTVMNMSRGVLIAPPPVMSRAFQELSRGIVKLQDAKKIADFPFPYPYAQTSVLMLGVHWCISPVLAAFLLTPFAAAATSFSVVFFLWCISFISLQLESPFGDDENDLPLHQMQSEWNKSIGTLLAARAQQPPEFEYDETVHRNLEMTMSDGSKGRKWLLTLPMEARPCAHQAHQASGEKEDAVAPTQPNITVAPSTDVPLEAPAEPTSAPKSKSPTSRARVSIESTATESTRRTSTKSNRSSFASTTGSATPRGSMQLYYEDSDEGELWEGSRSPAPSHYEITISDAQLSQPQSRSQPVSPVYRNNSPRGSSLRLSPRSAVSAPIGRTRMMTTLPVPRRSHTQDNLASNDHHDAHGRVSEVQRIQSTPALQTSAPASPISFPAPQVSAAESQLQRYKETLRQQQNQQTMFQEPPQPVVSPPSRPCPRPSLLEPQQHQHPQLLEPSAPSLPLPRRGSKENALAQYP
jgi:predicted membrane chloride channel (bestrophin family)